MGDPVLSKSPTSSNETGNSAFALYRIHEQNSIFKYTTMCPMIPKEMIYNLHCGDVRGDVLPPPYGTNTSCSVVKQVWGFSYSDDKKYTTDDDQVSDPRQTKTYPIASQFFGQQIWIYTVCKLRVYTGSAGLRLTMHIRKGAFFSLKVICQLSHHR